MSYLKYTPYVYLILAGFFIYDGIDKLDEAGNKFFISFGIAAVAIFMFFFRRNFARKIEERTKNQPRQ